MEKLVCWDKGREIIHQLPSWAKQAWFREINWLTIFCNRAGQWKIRTQLKSPSTSPCHASSRVQLHTLLFYLSLLASSSLGGWKMGLISVHNASSIPFLPPNVLPQPQHWFLLTGYSLSSIASVRVLPMACNSSRTAPVWVPHRTQFLPENLLLHGLLRTGWRERNQIFSKSPLKKDVLMFLNVLILLLDGEDVCLSNICCSRLPCNY